MGKGTNCTPGQIGHPAPVCAPTGRPRPRRSSRVVIGRRLSATSTPMFLNGGRVGRLLGVARASCDGNVEDHVAGVLPIIGDAKVRLVLPETEVEPGLEFLHPLGAKLGGRQIVSGDQSADPVLLGRARRSPATVGAVPGAGDEHAVEQIRAPAGCRSGRTRRAACRRSASGSVPSWRSG